MRIKLERPAASLYTASWGSAGEELPEGPARGPVSAAAISEAPALPASAVASSGRAARAASTVKTLKLFLTFCIAVHSTISATSKYRERLYRAQFSRSLSLPGSGARRLRHSFTTKSFTNWGTLFFPLFSIRYSAGST
jgi:hypothetical protein